VLDSVVISATCFVQDCELLLAQLMKTIFLIGFLLFFSAVTLLGDGSFLARDVIYTSCAYAMMPVCLSDGSALAHYS